MHHHSSAQLHVLVSPSWFDCHVGCNADTATNCFPNFSRTHRSRQMGVGGRLKSWDRRKKEAKIWKEGVERDRERKRGGWIKQVVLLRQADREIDSHDY